MENLHDEEREIDLRELFFALKKRILWIIAAALLGGCIACAYTQVFITPTYTSTSSVLDLKRDDIDFHCRPSAGYRIGP